MRLLLDTHIALWAIVDDKRLAASARSLILEPDNHIFISVASIWEIAIKHKLARGHRDDMPLCGERARDYFISSGYELLDITADHVVATASLPDLHKDPFDRLIIAQALQEPLRLVTHDRIMASYNDTIMLV